jgi:hypothetical protein
VKLFLFLLSFFIVIIISLLCYGVQCDTYKSSYNISQLNLPPCLVLNLDDIYFQFVRFKKTVGSFSVKGSPWVFHDPQGGPLQGAGAHSSTFLYILGLFLSFFLFFLFFPFLYGALNSAQSLLGKSSTTWAPRQEGAGYHASAFGVCPLSLSSSVTSKVWDSEQISYLQGVSGNHLWNWQIQH